MNNTKLEPSTFLTPTTCLTVACIAFSLVALSTIWSNSRRTTNGSDTGAGKKPGIRQRPQPQRRQAIDSLYTETRNLAPIPRWHSRQTQLGELVALCARVASLSRARGDYDPEPNLATVELLGKLSSLTVSLCRIQQSTIKEPTFLSMDPRLASCFDAPLCSLQATLLSFEASVRTGAQSSVAIGKAMSHIQEQSTMLESFLNDAGAAREAPTPPPESVVKTFMDVPKSGGAHLAPSPMFDLQTGIIPGVDEKCWIEPPPEYSPPAAGSSLVQPEKCGSKLEVQISVAESPQREDNPGDSSALYDAVITNNGPILDDLLGKGADPSAQFGALQRTPLHLAAHLNHVTCIVALLAHGAIMSIEDAKGDTALHLAAWAGHVEALITLLTRGADVDWLSGRDGYSALWCAISAHQIDAARLLLKHGARLSLRSASGCGLTPLHQAAVTGQSAMVELLLDRGAQVDCVDDDHNTPMHYAAASGSMSSVKILLRNGADVEAVQVHGLTAVHWASHKGHVEALRILLDHGARLDRKAADGATPLHLAANRGHVEPVRLLLACGANKCIGNAVWDGVSGTPAAMARAKGHKQLARLLNV